VSGDNPERAEVVRPSPIVVRGLLRRARDCRKLVSGESNSLYRGRLLGKASAYEHAAQLVQRAIERGEL